MAILVRASFQMREFEDRFVSLGLNYRVIGGPRFYERLEIRDAMAYFRVVCQPADDLAFERIVNTPKRGLGEATIKLLRDHGRARGIPMMQAVFEMVDTEELKPKQRNTLKQLHLNFCRWSDLLDNTKHTDLAEMILDESGYTEFWQNDRSAEAPGRLDNLKELIRSIDEFESLPGFLEHVSLVMDTDNNPDQEAVNLMTLHSAKGLEFDTVFLPVGKKAYSRTSAALMKVDARGWKKSAALPMWASPGHEKTAISGLYPTDEFMVNGRPRYRHASLMNCHLIT